MIIVMEYAAGGTLFDLIESRRREGKHLEEDELAHLFAQGNISLTALRETFKYLNLYLD